MDEEDCANCEEKFFLNNQKSPSGNFPNNVGFSKMGFASTPSVHSFLNLTDINNSKCFSWGSTPINNRSEVNYSTPVANKIVNKISLAPTHNTTYPDLPPLSPPCPLSAIGNGSKHTTSGAQCPFPPYTAVHIGNKSHNSNPNKKTTGSNCLETPEASIKMLQLSPNVSPTTQNKIFSGACLSIRMLDSINGIDLNSSSFEDEYNSTSLPKKISYPGPFSLSHWEMQLQFPDIEPYVHNSFFEWLSSTSANNLQSEWIVHYTPRFIKISGQTLKDQFALKKHMSLDLFDIAIRYVRQLDKAIYPSDIPLRWRHLLESDYAMHVLGSENPIENKSIREQFLGPACDYEVSRCRMFFVPVYVESKWWCYAWDLKAEIVFIIDPSVSVDTTKNLYKGWSPKFPSCHACVLRFVGMPYPSYDFGILTLFCLMHFDGRKLVLDPSEANLYNFRSYFLYQLMEMKDNAGRKSPSFVQYIS